MFNAVLFDGEQKLHPEDFREADVDLSSVLKFNGHLETIQRLRDVVKKTAYGMDFVIWGIENQQKIHYAMPLRHMIEDALSYLKEYNEIAKKNIVESVWESLFWNIRMNCGFLIFTRILFLQMIRSKISWNDTDLQIINYSGGCFLSI